MRVIDAICPLTQHLLHQRQDQEVGGGILQTAVVSQESGLGMKNVKISRWWSLLLGGLFLSASHGIGAAAQVFIQFDQPRYDISPGQTFQARLVMVPSPAAGLGSYGGAVKFPPANAIIASTAAVSVPAPLSFDGVFGPGAKKAVSTGFAGVKGTVDFSLNPLVPYPDSDLATFQITDLGLGSYILQSGFFNTLGPTEQIFIAGDGTVLDPQLSFGSALVNYRPSVSIVSPTDGSSFPAGFSLPIVAEANDLDGSVTNVCFFVGTNKLGSASALPFSIVWTNPPSSMHLLSAVAVDNHGALATSAVVQIQIGFNTATQTACPGDVVTLSAPVVVTPPFQWLRDGNFLSGQTNASLVLSNITDSAAGLYCVESGSNQSSSCTRLLVLANTTVSLAAVGDVFLGDLPPLSFQETNPICFIAKFNYPESYLRHTVTNTPVGYALADGAYTAWCIEYPDVIYDGVTYRPKIFRPNDPQMPSYLQSPYWDRVHYILNHKQGDALDVQGAIWHFIGGPATPGDPMFYPPTSLSSNIVDEALLNGAGFTPGPGQVRAIIFDLGPNLQTTIIEARCRATQRFIGDTVQLAATPAGSGPFVWKWWKDGQLLASAAASLTLTNLTPADAGEYFVEATGACNTASDCLRLIVTPGLRVRLLLVGGMAQLFWDATPGVTYKVQCRNTVISPWTDITGTVQATNTLCVKEVPLPALPQQFYRIIQVSP